MKHQLLTTGLLLAAVLLIGLVTLSGTLLLVATPLVLLVLGSWLLAPPEVTLELDRRLHRDRAHPDEPVTVTVQIRNRGQGIQEFTVTDRLPAGITLVSGTPRLQTVLPAGATTEFSYVVAGSRGSYHFTTITVEAAGDLPLRARTITVRQEDELVLLPDHRALSRIPIAPRRTLVYAGTNPARQGGEGTEFFDVREYRGNEPLRHVNWRASARRSGQLFVNEFQQERVADVAILLDCRKRAYPGGGRRLFDAAASAAASLADVTLDDGNRVGYLGYGLSIDWLAPGFGRIQKHRVLTRIARTEPGDSHVFFRLDAIPERLFPPGSQVIVVSPLTADDPPDIERLQAYGYAVMVVTPDPTPLQIPEDPDPVTRQAARLVRLERAVLLQRLRHAGVAVVDWDTSESFEQAVGAALGGILAAWRRRRR